MSLWNMWFPFVKFSIENSNIKIISKSFCPVRIIHWIHRKMFLNFQFCCVQNILAIPLYCLSECISFYCSNKDWKRKEHKNTAGKMEGMGTGCSTKHDIWLNSFECILFYILYWIFIKTFFSLFLLKNPYLIIFYFKINVTIIWPLYNIRYYFFWYYTT